MFIILIFCALALNAQVAHKGFVFCLNIVSLYIVLAYLKQ